MIGIVPNLAMLLTLGGMLFAGAPEFRCLGVFGYPKRINTVIHPANPIL